MKNAHIAIFNVPAYTTTNPTISMVATLIRRGYRVTYVTSARHANELTRMGAEVLLCPRMEFPHDQAPNLAGPVESQYSTSTVDLAARTLQLVSPFYEHYRPDLVLYEGFAFSGLILARALRVPAIRITPQLAVTKEYIHHMQADADVKDSIYQLIERTDKFVRDHGVNRPEVVFNNEEPTIYFYTRDLQISPHMDESTCLYAGRCAPERPLPTQWHNAQRDARKTILVAASTTHAMAASYYWTCINALAGLDCSIILAPGSNVSSTDLGELPAHCQVARDVPLPAIMPHADLLIGFGGPCTTMEALYHGLPMLMLTHNIDGRIYSDNVQRLGVGMHLTGAEVTEQNIRACAIEIMNDQALLERVKAQQVLLKRSPGAEDVANWIEDYMGWNQASA